MTEREPMTKRTLYFCLTALLAACGGGSGGGDVPADETRSAATTSRDAADQYSRASFVLCEPIEEHRQELAGIVGIEPDLERAVQGSGARCVVHGTDRGFMSIEIAPAVTPSIAVHAEGYEGTKTPVPSLGASAVFVDASLQPHVIFELGNLILDVGAESSEAPGRDAMVQLATRVRAILVAAN